ncbi:MAG: hypothetical protein AAF456_03210 [Planctomycetota bacterium]
MTYEVLEVKPPFEQQSSIGRPPYLFAGFLIFIAITSLIDAGLVLWFSETILHLEANPLCMALMKLEPQFFSVFLACKFIGTAAVIITINQLFRRRRAIALCVAAALAMFQFGLMIYQFAV